MASSNPRARSRKRRRASSLQEAYVYHLRDSNGYPQTPPPALVQRPSSAQAAGQPPIYPSRPKDEAYFSFGNSFNSYSFNSQKRRKLKEQTSPFPGPVLDQEGGNPINQHRALTSKSSTPPLPVSLPPSRLPNLDTILCWLANIFDDHPPQTIPPSPPVSHLGIQISSLSSTMDGSANSKPSTSTRHSRGSKKQAQDLSSWLQNRRIQSTDGQYALGDHEEFHNMLLFVLDSPTQFKTNELSKTAAFRHLQSLNKNEKTSESAIAILISQVSTRPEMHIRYIENDDCWKPYHKKKLPIEVVRSQRNAEWIWGPANNGLDAPDEGEVALVTLDELHVMFDCNTVIKFRPEDWPTPAHPGLTSDTLERDSQPDGLWGFEMEVFTDEELRKINRYPELTKVWNFFHTAHKVFIASFLWEGKPAKESGDGVHPQAQNGGFQLCQKWRILNTKLKQLANDDVAGSEGSAVDKESFVFSMTTNSKGVSVWVHFAETEMGITSYHMATLKSFAFNHHEQIQAFRRTFLAIIQWMRFQRLPELTAKIGRLPG